MSLILAGDEGDQSQIHLRMLQILREFSTDQVLSLYVIDDIWEFMDAMKVSYISQTCLITLLVFFFHHPCGVMVSTLELNKFLYMLYRTGSV